MPSRRDDPLLAVVSPPRLERFRELVGLAPGDPVECDFSGWSKLIVLAGDLAVLFPRDHRHVEPLEREVEALRAVAGAGLAEIPRVLHVWEDAGLGPYPAVAISRCSGVALEAVLDGLSEDVLVHIAAQAGGLAARWHDLDPSALAARPQPPVEQRSGLAELLGVDGEANSPALAAKAAADTLDLEPDLERRAAAALERARALATAIVHGDIHEGQLLVDPERDYRVCGVIDWQTARIGPPMAEFNLGEWGPTLWRQHRTAFPRLRRAWWDAYSSARGLVASPELGAVFEWLHATGHALDFARGRCEAQPREVTGTLDEARATAVAAAHALPRATGSATGHGTGQAP